MNLLSKAKSPYLLQHKDNPVHWQEWSDHFPESKQLKIISIGYAACHWCHVMEHESFESDEVAGIMNASFDCIKVDREERPDIDAIYMEAVQLMTRQGGWPLNVVTLPNGRPIWGGTYFRKEHWMESLSQLAHLWETQPEKLIEYADKLMQGIQQLQILPNPQKEIIPIEVIQASISRWKNNWDMEHGGFGGAPKFMMPVNLKFLQRWNSIFPNQVTKEFLDTTMSQMFMGGIYDHAGGGFSRYSVDARWHVPHFEKMLYDNGLLLSLYSNWYFNNGVTYSNLIERTTEYWLHDFMVAPNGGFYSSQDADSLNENGILEEGAYYVWTHEELENIFKNTVDTVKDLFSIKPETEWEHGKYILQLDTRINDYRGAKTNGMHRKLDGLREHRKNHRTLPRLDDKILTSWNCYMLDGLLDTIKMSPHPIVVSMIDNSLAFLYETMSQKDGKVYHAYKEGETYIDGFMEDYAMLCQSLLKAYSRFGDKSLIERAHVIAQYAMQHFYDTTSEMFKTNSSSSIIKLIEVNDNVTPNPNAIMMRNLVVLGKFYNNSDYIDIASNALKRMSETIVQHIGLATTWCELALDI